MNQNYVEEKLIPTWNWMVSIMDSTEAQLRYGSALSSAGDPGHPSHPLHASQHSARRERMTAREEASLRTLEGRRYAVNNKFSSNRESEEVCCTHLRIFAFIAGEQPHC